MANHQEDAMNDKAIPRFFETPAAMRSWLAKYHLKANELHVGYFKRRAIKGATSSLTWSQSVAEAICFGWIDGIRRTIDEDRYTIRFTPRRRGSKWSAANIRLIAELEAAGRMTDAGRAVFEARKEPQSPGYKAEKKTGTLDEDRLCEFQRNKSAWAFFVRQTPGYQKEAAWWVMHAKREETRDRRLTTLINVSAAGKRLG
jgi:uncharacterized protein YdeI (YjbR/CyaY-like superfamily)